MREKMKIPFKPRRVRRINYTRVVSLPKIWLSVNHIEDGDLVLLEMQEDGSLIIAKGGGHGEKDLAKDLE